MHTGLIIFATEYAIRIDELARAAEERGFESLFLPEHTHIPTARRTPWGGGDVLPRHYYRTLDPFLALTAAAAATTRLRLGTGVCLVIQRDPIVTAKEVATLDVLSGGRFELGVGAGWNREEIEHHGTPFERRFGVLRERVEAMKALWTQDEAIYEGRYVSFESSAAWPKPVQRPHPPILVGGNGERVLDRVLRYGDGWFPNREARLAERVAELQRRAAEAGRGRIPVTYFGADPDRAAVERLTAAGVDRILFYLPSAPAADVERVVDDLAGLIAAS
jgi:probable F420-dependent oxidoreductase